MYEILLLNIPENYAILEIHLTSYDFYTVFTILHDFMFREVIKLFDCKQAILYKCLTEIIIIFI